jgi:maltose O-acetyltransferase
MLGLAFSCIEKLKQYKRKKYIDSLKSRGLKLGKNILIADTFFFDPSHCYLISIGDNCYICPNVRLVAHDASTKLFLNYTKFGKIDIKENCFIGDSTIVLPNVTIGPNSIVGAGSIVTKTIPPGVVAAGNPARVICTLDEYVSKVKARADAGAKVFGEEYYIENLDRKKLNELMESVEQGIGFII